MFSVLWAEEHRRRSKAAAANVKSVRLSGRGVNGAPSPWRWGRRSACPGRRRRRPTSRPRRRRRWSEGRGRTPTGRTAAGRATRRSWRTASCETEETSETLAFLKKTKKGEEPDSRPARPQPLVAVRNQSHELILLTWWVIQRRDQRCHRYDKTGIRRGRPI